MIKCQPFPSAADGGLFHHSNGDSSDSSSGSLVSVDCAQSVVDDQILAPSTPVPASPASGGRTRLGSEMGADRSMADIANIVGTNFMESATSIFKVYFRDSLSSDDSSNSNVAIDNKIEQAMDLVKSHLMFAVREEVEILKEQIKELLAKNSRLEYENNILRADATPETLAKLQAATGPPAVVRP